MWESLWQWFLTPANQRLAVGLVIAFGVGLLAATALRRSGEEKSPPPRTKGDKAFFKGIQYILSNDHDHAIEEFTKSVQVNSDTVETYVALGNLYRSRGDIDRAIRIRQSIILRPGIDEQIRLRALLDLGYDFRKGGFLNRALGTFLQVVEREPSNVEVWGEIEKIYEELKDWENAYQCRQKIARISPGDHRHIMAHHLVEQAKTLEERGEFGMARPIFHKALSTDRRCADAYLHLGDLHFRNGEYRKAISAWEKIVEAAPEYTFLAYHRLEGAYSEMKDLRPVEAFLKKCAQADSDAFTHLALSRYLFNEGDMEGALKEINTALELAPSFWAARRFKGEMLLRQARQKDALEEYKALLEHLDVPYLRFQCSDCGFEPSDLQWQCPQCRRWDTIHRIDAAKGEPKLPV